MVTAPSRLSSLTSLFLLALVTFGCIRTADAQGQMVPYTGTVCKDYISYPVWLPPNVTVADMDAGLVAAGVDQLSALINPCKDAIMALYCASTYPAPVQSATGGHTYNVLFACKSTCQTVASICNADLTFLNQTSVLPNCAGIIPGTDMISPPGIAFQPDGACNNIMLTSQSTNTTCPTPMSVCPAPFVTDQSFVSSGGLINTDDEFCSCGCCLPCPQTNAFYKPGLLDQGFSITDYLKTISAVCVFILVISYLALPAKLQYPSNLIFHTALATFIFMVVVGFSLGNPRRVQCAANGVTPADSYNNTLCTVQGGLLLFGALGAAAWISVVIVNLHLHTVWNSDWLKQRQWFAYGIGWVVPLTFAIIAVVTKSIQWNNSNMCMVSQAASNTLMFIPLGVLVVPSTLLHIATFVHILKVTLGAHTSETVSHSTLSSGKAARVSHRRHVANAIRIQWRAASLALVASASVLIYWAFYLVEGAKTDMSWMTTWQLCIFTGLSQTECASRFAESHVPNFVFMIFAETLVSTTGLWIFLLFFKKATVVEWKELFSGWVCCGGGRARKRENEQFYAIS